MTEVPSFVRDQSGCRTRCVVGVAIAHVWRCGIRARNGECVGEILNSLSHGTGRKMSRSDCKPLADSFDFAAMRKRILIPTGVNNSSLRTDGPFAYRDLDECMALINGYVEPVMRFGVIGCNRSRPGLKNCSLRTV